MPVNSTHHEYAEYAKGWERIRDCIDGELEVKEEGAKYLPAPEGMSTSQYDAYKTRADFYESTGRVWLGLVGAIFRKDPVIDVPEAQQPLVDAFSADGAPLEIFAKNVVGEVVAVGRHGLLVDVPNEGGRPYVAAYRAEDIINWRCRREGHAEVLEMVVLREDAYVPKDEDPFETKEVERYRVLQLEGDGVSFYTATLYEKTTNAQGKEEFLIVDGPTIPKARGKALTRIPFIFVGVMDLESHPDDPPLLPLANKNLSHYRSSADIEHGAHFTALPTPVIIGQIAGNAEGEGGGIGDLSIGSGTAWNIVGDGADAKYLEFTGQGLSALETRIEKKEKHMAVLGARLLEDQKAGVEAFGTVVMRHSGENSVLASIAGTVSRALTRALKFVIDWNAGLEPGTGNLEVSVALNHDFFAQPMATKDIVDLTESWLKGAIGEEIVFDSLKKGERLPDNWTIEDFRRDREMGGPTAAFGPMTFDASTAVASAVVSGTGAGASA